MGKLIRLELYNFKSYRGHHKLLFGDSFFTSIIGPNGSGKSNSMDAISFVLGIKSSHLRSSQLKDLVYRGRVMKTSKIQDDGTAAPADDGQAEYGDSAKSVRGDPKTAWVMAIYEDDAGDELRWKRTITNQGSSEFRINDRVVTAQQYNEALEAENILIKARNFLVFQGDVEAIAAQSPQDLTRLIEQISGSLEYRADYDRLRAELEEAAEVQTIQVHKRRGINSEIKQYAEQKKEAEAFQTKSDERDQAVVTRMVWKLYHLQKAMKKACENIWEHKENLKEFRRNLREYEETLQAARNEQAEAARRVAKIEKDSKKKEREIEANETKLVPLEEQIAESKKELEKLGASIIKLSGTRDRHAENVKFLEKSLKDHEKQRQMYENALAKKMKVQGKELSDEDLEEYKTLQAEARAKSAANRTKSQQLEQQLQDDKGMLGSLDLKRKGFDQDIKKFEQTIEDLKTKLEQQRDAEKDLTVALEIKTKEFNTIKTEQIRVRNKQRELDGKLTEVRDKIRLAESSLSHSKKENEMRNTVTTLKRLYSGVRGRIGDLCKPKQKKFDEAVATALMVQYDAVVTDSEATAIECIAYLKTNQKSPMQFIPIDNVKVATSSANFKSVPGARLTIETIDFDPSIERAIAYACGDSVVCDNLEIAKDLVYNRRMHVRAVTLQGMEIGKGGEMTGGRTDDTRGQGGKRQFGGEVALGHLQEVEQKFDAELSKLPPIDRRTEDALQAEVNNLNSRLNRVQEEVKALIMNIRDTEKKLAKAEADLRELMPRLEEKSSHVHNASTQIRRFESAIHLAEDKVFARFCKRLGYENIRAYEEQHGALAQEAEEQRQEYETVRSKVRSELDMAKSQYDNVTERLQRCQKAVTSKEQKILAFEQEKEHIEEAKVVQEDELGAINETLEKAKRVHARKAAKVGEARQVLSEKSEDVQGREKEIRILEQEVIKKSSEKARLLRQCKLERIMIPLNEGNLDDIPDDNELLERDEDAMDVDGEENNGGLQAAVANHGIVISYETLPENLLEDDGQGVDDELQENINTLASEIENLNPNMRSCERLDETRRRLEAAETEFEDAKAAHKAAKDAFDHVKKERFRKFNEAYTHIKEQIDTVYKDLTRSEAFPLGGQAYLDVEEDEEPYNAGVKYTAMPPLKRFRDMEHLSGGEKTMAALALLFAIHSFQPSPFFVLDEIDAALDNANVDKIKKYIANHAGPGMQFIVISLKPNLFQDSQSLVGILRDQELNSSKALTLDLRKYA